MLFDPPTQDRMAFPGFSLLYDPEFQQRWDFRNWNADSSSDDAKSDSGIEPAVEKHKLVPGLIPPQDDGPAHSPGIQEETINPEGGCGVITPNLKEATRRRRKEKSIKKKKVIEKKGVDRELRKRENIVYDTGLLDDLMKFRESVVEELRIERENLFGWMKDEMNKLAGNNAASNNVDNNLPLRNRGSARRKKSGGDAEKSKGGPSGRSSRRKKTAESVSCSQALANEKQPEAVVDRLKSPIFPSDHGLQALQQNSLSAGEKIPISAASVEKDGGETSELLGNTNRSLSQAPALNFLAVPRDENQQPANSSFSFPSVNPGKKIDAGEFSGYYHLLLQEGRLGNSVQMGPKSNTSSFQNMLSSTMFHRDSARGFSNTSTDRLPSQNALAGGDNVLGLRMTGGPVRLLGHGSNYF